MCPLWPFHIIFMYLGVLGPLWLATFGVIGAAAESASSPNVTFSPHPLQHLKVGQSRLVEFTFNKTEILEQAKVLGFTEFEFLAADPYIAYVTPVHVELESSEPILEEANNNTGGDPKPSGLDKVSFNVTGNFLGKTEICSVASSSQKNNESKVFACLPVSVIRESGPIDKAFTYSVATLVAVLYVNMGAALDMSTIKETIKRPYGPGIGFMSQFVIMPLLSFAIAKLLIPRADLQLGLFITGCSPGGGASNIWTLALGGNLDLSITMTTISTLATFLMMPFWIFTLGSTIFAEAKLTIPYSKIATFAISLLIPLAIGIGIQYKWPKVAKFLVKILKPFALFLIVFIVIFAVYTNLYLFRLFSWQILLSGLLLPWLGYLLGGGTAWLLKQEWRDILAIGIETGVQNTGLAIFALRFSLPQPEADLTTVLPVAVAMMTPILPSVLMLYQKYTGMKMVKEQRASISQNEPIHTNNSHHQGDGNGIAGIDMTTTNGFVGIDMIANGNGHAYNNSHVEQSK